MTTISVPSGIIDVDILQVVQRAPKSAEISRSGLWRALGTGMRSSPLKIARRERFGIGEHGFARPGEEQLAAEFAGAGTEIDDVVGGGEWCRDRARRPGWCCRGRAGS